MTTSLVQPPAGPVKPTRFLGVDALRGVAAMSVCFCHFAIGSPTFLAEDSWIRAAGWYAGLYGVQIFFVISGFVIALNLLRAGYQPKNAPAYLLRRVMRIDPPFLASLAIALVLEHILRLLPHFHGPPPLAWYQILSHVGYLNGLLGWRWEISIYWSLAIEFQYYICVTLFFPLLFSRVKWISFAAIGLWSVVGFAFPAETTLFRYGSLFATGFILCRHLERRADVRETLLLTALNAVCVARMFGEGTLLVTILTAAGIYFWREPAKPWRFLGQISYSLYLIHGIIGFHLVNGFVKFVSAANAGPVVACLVILFAFAVTIACSWVFWLCVERPSHRLAQRISLKPQQS